MMVAGAVKDDRQSAQRCALGARRHRDGVGLQHNRADHEKIERIRQRAPT